MNTHCPHCQIQIEIDSETLATLQGHPHFQCPSCAGLVPVPPVTQAPVKVTAAAVGRSVPVRVPAATLASAHRGLNRNFLILGAVALLLIGGLGFYLASKKSGDIHNTDQRITNEIINNSYFQNLIATGVTTRRDLEEVAVIRPFEGGYIGISKEALDWQGANGYAGRTGSVLLSAGQMNGVVERGLASRITQVLPQAADDLLWMRIEDNQAIFAKTEFFPTTSSDHAKRVLLHWDASGKPLTRRIENLERNHLDSLLLMEANTGILPPHDWSFENLDYKVNILTENKPFPVYKTLWGKSDVFVIHPINHTEPGFIDFSNISKNHRGKLNLNFRNHLHGDCLIKITKAGKYFSDIDVSGNEWKAIAVPLDGENILVQVFATGWGCEHAFVTYSVE